MKRRAVAAALLLAVALAGCAGKEDAGDVVEAYFSAAVEADAARMRALSCADWEAGAERQAQSFRSVKSTLEGMRCRASGEEGGFTLVSCEGEVVMDYNGELREFPLGRYRVAQEAGDWRFCGEG